MRRSREPDARSDDEPCPPPPAGAPRQLPRQRADARRVAGHRPDKPLRRRVPKLDVAPSAADRQVSPPLGPGDGRHGVLGRAQVAQLRHARRGRRPEIHAAPESDG